MKSIGTDPLALTSDDMKWLVQDLTRQQEAEAKATQDAGRPQAGYGILSKIGETLGRSVPLAIGDVASGLLGGLGLPMTPQGNPLVQGAQAMGAKGADLIAPPPVTPGQQMAEAGTRGAMGGVVAGPAGMVGGAGSGLAGEGAAQLGGGPIAQFLASLAGGAVAGGVATVAGRRGAANQSTRAVVKQMEQGGEPARPQLQAARGSAGADPSVPGRELLGRAGDEMAQQAAHEGGEGGTRIVRAAEERLNQTTERFLTRVQNTLGKRGDLDVTRSLDEAQAAATGDTYKRLRYQPVEVTSDLAELLDDPIVQRAYNEGVTIHNSRVGVKGEPDAGLPVRRFPPLIDERTEAIRGELPLGALDEMKKGLDNLVTRGERGEGGGITARQAAAVQGRLESIRDAVDLQYKEYGQVRALSKGFFDQKDALQFGRELLKPTTTDDIVRQRLGDLDATDPKLRIHVKMGLADAFAKGEIPADWASNPQIRARVQTLLTPEEFTNLDKLITKAARAVARSQAVVNAGTARAGAVEGSRMGRIGFEIAVGLQRSAARDYVTEVSSKVRFKPAVRSEVADVLNVSGPDFQARITDLLRRQGNMSTAFGRSTAGAGVEQTSGARRE